MHIMYTLCIPWCFSEGVDTVSEHNEGLRPGCFVAMEAVSWLIENFEEQTSRDQVVEVLQVSHVTIHDAWP